jgi:hypothetical protein
MKKLLNYEREFTATISDDESEWHVASASLKYVNKLKKLGWVPDHVVGEYSFFEVPRRCIGFRNLEKKKVGKNVLNALSKARLSQKPLSTVSNRKASVKSSQ